jgi:hypothetical protein
MKLLNIETPVTRNFIPQILLNVQDFYFRKVGYTSYDEGILASLSPRRTKHIHARVSPWESCGGQCGYGDMGVSRLFISPLST